MTEYWNAPIPEDSRQSGWKVLIVSMGLTAVAVNMLVGGVLGSTMTVLGWSSSILVGGFILAGIGVFTAYHSHGSGKTFALQSAEIFGPFGSRLLAAVVASVILGWYTIQASLLGNAIAAYFSVEAPYDTVLLAVTPGVLAVTAISGFRSLVGLSAVAVPAIFLLSVVALTSPAATTANVVVSPTTPWPQALSMVIALWIMGAVATIGDVTRYASRRAAAVASAAVAFIIGNTGLMLVGAWASVRFGTGDLSEVLGATGLPLLGLLLLVANIWSTNDNAIYSVGLNLAHLGRRDYRAFVAIAAVLSCVASVFRPYESGLLTGWLTSLGIVVPALGGGIIGRRLGRTPNRAMHAWLGVFIGGLVAYGDPIGFGSILGLVTAAAAVYILDRSL